MDDEYQKVDEADVRRWVTSAHTCRVASYILGEVGDPVPGSPLAGDDQAYRWDKCSDWTRSGLVAALDHLLVWANIVAPQTVFDGMEVRNPPRPYYTLARAALESAAQAVWVLDQEISAERVQRHLRLLYHDLRHMAVAFELVDDERAPVARERMKLLGERLDDAEAYERIKKGEPKYSMMVRECANAMNMTTSEAEVLWRSASAAAHGKNWFQHVAYTITAGEQYEPGQFRAMLSADPDGITRSVTAAARLAMYGVMRFVMRAGSDPDPLYSRALERLMAETPLNEAVPNAQDESE